jgi:hypothetical protein
MAAAAAQSADILPGGKRKLAFSDSGKEKEAEEEGEGDVRKRNFQDQWCCTNRLWKQCEPWRDIRGRLKDGKFPPKCFNTKQDCQSQCFVENDIQRNIGKFLTFEDSIQIQPQLPQAQYPQLSAVIAKHLTTINPKYPQLETDLSYSSTDDRTQFASVFASITKILFRENGTAYYSPFDYRITLIAAPLLGSALVSYTLLSGHAPHDEFHARTIAETKRQMRRVMGFLLVKPDAQKLRAYESEWKTRSETAQRFYLNNPYYLGLELISLIFNHNVVYRFPKVWYFQWFNETSLLWFSDQPGGRGRLLRELGTGEDLITGASLMRWYPNLSQCDQSIMIWLLQMWMRSPFCPVAQIMENMQKRTGTFVQEFLNEVGNDYANHYITILSAELQEQAESSEYSRSLARVQYNQQRIDAWRKEFNIPAPITLKEFLQRIQSAAHSYVPEFSKAVQDITRRNFKTTSASLVAMMSQAQLLNQARCMLIILANLVPFDQSVLNPAISQIIVRFPALSQDTALFRYLLYAPPASTHFPAFNILRLLGAGVDLTNKRKEWIAGLFLWIHPVVEAALQYNRLKPILEPVIDRHARSEFSWDDMKPFSTILKELPYEYRREMFYYHLERDGLIHKFWPTIGEVRFVDLRSEYDRLYRAQRLGFGQSGSIESNWKYQANRGMGEISLEVILCFWSDVTFNSWMEIQIPLTNYFHSNPLNHFNPERLPLTLINDNESEGKQLRGLDDLPLAVVPEFRGLSPIPAAAAAMASAIGSVSQIVRQVPAVLLRPAAAAAAASASTRTAGRTRVVNDFF